MSNNKRKLRGREPIKSVHQRNAEILQGLLARGSDGGRGSVREADTSDFGLEVVPEQKHSGPGVDIEINLKHPLDQLAEDTALGRGTDWKVKAQIVNDGRIRPSQVSDAILRGIKEEEWFWPKARKERE